MLRHERQHTLRFASLDSDIGVRIRGRHPELARADSMAWVDDPESEREHVEIRSAAALRVATYMGGPWRLAAVGRLVPRWIRDRLYDVIARHRHRIMGEPEQCYVPPPAVRVRFLDMGSGL